MSLWKPYQPSDKAPWNLERVVHLHRRAAFAATWHDIQRHLECGPADAVDDLLRGPDGQGLGRQQAPNDFEAMSKNIGQAATASNNAMRLKAWWFFRMLNSPDPLGERLTLMWHNHFATSNRKVENLLWMMAQNEILRTHSRASFGHLLAATLKHPAMLKWLDADANRKGHPNENLGRELLELFTLGIGNYTEQDVQAAARALTGWTIKADTFAYRASRHDNGVLELFGKQMQLNGDGLLEQLLQHPATAQRLAWRICKTFMGHDTCDAAAVTEIAAGLRKHELNIGWAIQTVLRSQRFFEAKNLRTRIVGPAEHVIAAITALELLDPPPSTLQLAEWSARMGQDLFYPPNVGGWNEGRAWLGSRAMIARFNFGHALSTGELWRSHDAATIESSLEDLLRRHSAGSTMPARATWLANLLWGTSSPSSIQPITSGISDSHTPLADIVGRLLASPEYQLA